MNILFTTPRGHNRDIYFPPATLAALEKLGTVTFNDKDSALTSDELAHSIRDQDVCLTHWACPTFDEAVLNHANQLKLIAHAGGSVGDLVTDAGYQRGIQVCSANSVMAKSVAEGVLTYILAGLRQVPCYDRAMKTRQPWDRCEQSLRSLFGAKVGLVGFGAIARYLLDLLVPFGVQVKVYDPYSSPAALAPYANAQWCPTVEEVLAWADIVSLHSSLTPETLGLINRERLKLIRPGALFVNTARGAIVDEAALIEELQQGRFNAVLDVYATEPLPSSSPLRDLENVILLPHVACAVKEELTFAVIEEIARFSRGEPLQHAIPQAKFALMTQERLVMAGQLQ